LRYQLQRNENFEFAYCSALFYFAYLHFHYIAHFSGDLGILALAFNVFG